MSFGALKTALSQKSHQQFSLEREEVTMLPDLVFWQVLPLSIMIAGLAIMLRLRRLQLLIVGIMACSVALKLIPTLVGTGWGKIVIAIFVVYSGMGLLRKFLVAVLGSEAGGHVLGTWVLRITDALFFLPFRFLRWLFSSR